MSLQDLNHLEKKIGAMNMSISLTNGNSRELHKSALDEAIREYVPLAREFNFPDEHIEEVYQTYKKGAGKDHIKLEEL